jgi:tripartite-type tricarboxylate transporter receptor subunit TctC
MQNGIELPNRILDKIWSTHPMAGYFSKCVKIIIFALVATTASAQSWEPTKPINVIIGFAPGSGNELSFRGISSIIEKANPKINFIIENRPGADGVVAMNEFIKKPANGHYIYIPSHQGIWVNAEYFYKSTVKYTLDDFEYVVSIAKSPIAVIAHSASSVNSVPDLLTKLKTTTKPITFATGSSSHKLAFEYMATKIKFDTELIKTASYKGPAQAVQDVAGGHVEFGIAPVAVAASLAKSGHIKIIGLCSESPVAGLDAPLMNKWIPGMNIYAAWGIILPKNTPIEIQQWYITLFSTTIRSAEAKQFFDQNYMFFDPKELTSDGFRSSMNQLRSQWIPIIKNLPIE